MVFLRCSSVCRGRLVVTGFGVNAWDFAGELPEFDGFGGSVIDCEHVSLKKQNALPGNK